MDDTILYVKGTIFYKNKLPQETCCDCGELIPHEARFKAKLEYTVGGYDVTFYHRDCKHED